MLPELKTQLVSAKVFAVMLVAWFGVPVDSGLAQETLPETVVPRGSGGSGGGVGPATTDIAPDMGSLPYDFAGDDLSEFEFSPPMQADRLFGASLRDFGDQWDGGSRTPLNLLQDPGHRSVIDLQRIQRQSPVELFDAIQREVGVLVQRTQRGAAAPFVRGLTGQQVLILVDGIRMNNATFRSGPNQYFNLVDPGMVERIEVLRGSQSVLYGADAIGGVINIVTRSASDRFFKVGSSSSWVNRFSTADNGYYTRANHEGTTETVAGFFGGGYGNFNDLDRGGDLGRQPLTSFSHFSGDGKVDFLIDENSMVTVAMQHFSQEDVARSDRFPNRLTIFDPQQRTLAYIRYQGIDFGGWFDRLMFTASYHRLKEGVFDQRLSTTNIDLSETDNHSFGMNLLMSSDLGPIGRLTYGVDMVLDAVDSVKDRYDATSGLFVESRTPTYPNDGIYSQTGFFGQWNVDLTPRLSAQTGIRYSYIYASGTPIIPVDADMDPMTPAVDTPVRIAPNFDDWSMTGGLNLELTPNLHVVTSVSEGFRAPNLDDLAATNENVQQDAVDTPSVNLRPERSISYDLGLKSEQDGFRGQFFYFWTDIDNMILRTPATGTTGSTLFSRSNRDAHINGLELSGAVEVASNWELYGNMSYVLGVDLVQNEPLSRIPPTQGILGTRWANESNTYVDFFAWLSGSQDRLNFQDMTDSRIPARGTPGFATFNLRVGTQLGQSQRVSLNLENILDQAYRVHGSGVDGPGFSAIVSYELFR